MQLKKMNQETQTSTKRDPPWGEESNPLGGVAYQFHRKQKSDDNNTICCCSSN